MCGRVNIIQLSVHTGAVVDSTVSDSTVLVASSAMGGLTVHCVNILYLKSTLSK